MSIRLSHLARRAKVPWVGVGGIGGQDVATIRQVMGSI